MNTQRVLALDYGLKRVGLAISDPMRMIANGLPTVQNHNLFPTLDQLLVEYEIADVVIGESKKMNNEHGDIEDHIQKFIKTFRKKYPEIQVSREDERFTSKIAVQSMVMGGVKKKDRRNKGLVDKTSAVLILQSYLDRT